jgi:hypothetical protein
MSRNVPPAESRKNAGNGAKREQKSELFLMKFSRAGWKLSAAIEACREKKLPAARAARKIH